MKIYTSLRTVFSSAVEVILPGRNNSQLLPIAPVGLDSSAEENYEYLKSGFTLSHSWYIKYGTLASNKIYDEMFTQMSLDTASSVFESGSGPGNGIDKLIERVPKTCQVIASDINEEFLTLIQNKSHKQVKIIEANFEQLPLQDESIDRYVSNMAIHNSTNPLKPLKEAFRALTTSGVLGVSVFGKDNNTYLEINKKFRQFTGLPYHSSLIHNLDLIGDTTSLEELGRKAGFKYASAFTAVANYPYVDPQEAMDLFLTFEPYIEWMKRNRDKVEQFREFVYNELYECLVRRGKPLGYEAIVLIGHKD